MCENALLQYGPQSFIDTRVPFGPRLPLDTQEKFVDIGPDIGREILDIRKSDELDHHWSEKKDIAGQPCIWQGMRVRIEITDELKSLLRR